VTAGSLIVNWTPPEPELLEELEELEELELDELEAPEELSDIGKS